MGPRRAQHDREAPRSQGTVRPFPGSWTPPQTEQHRHGPPGQRGLRQWMPLSALVSLLAEGTQDHLRCGERDMRLPGIGRGWGSSLPSGLSTAVTALPSPHRPGKPLSPGAGWYSGSWQGGTPGEARPAASLAPGLPALPPGACHAGSEPAPGCPAWTLGRPLQGRRRPGLGLPPGPHPTAAGNTCGGGCPASRPAAALGKDSWSQPGAGGSDGQAGLRANGRWAGFPTAPQLARDSGSGRSLLTRQLEGAAQGPGQQAGGPLWAVSTVVPRTRGWC